MSGDPTSPVTTRILRGLRRRCARCGARAFTGYFTMHTDCPECGLHFEREEGYWVGALIINTTVTFATFVIVFVTGIATTWPDVPWVPIGIATIALNAAIPILFYPISKTLWMALELGWHPLETEEIEAAESRRPA